MASALTALINATATFALPTAGTTTDAYGNVVPLTENVTVSLFLRQSPTTEQTFPGVDVSQDIFDGYAVNPQALDARIKPGVQGTVTFSSGTATTCEVLASRYPHGTAGLIGSTVQAVLGDKIRLRSVPQR